MNPRHVWKLSLALAAVAAASIQGQVPEPGIAPAVDTARDPATPALVARSLTRVALVDLRATGTPGPADFRIAASLLRDASNLDPTNQDVLRLAIDAARQADDPALTIDLLKKLVRLDPDDTAAQLGLIEAKASLSNTAAERAAIYETLAGPRGESLDPSVRSRCALRAATLKREQGDAQGFADMLTLAVQSDPSNAAAAGLAFSYFADRVNQPVGRIELLSNLLAADPFDPASHAMLAREFAQAGAGAASYRFYENARVLSSRLGQTLPLEDQADRIVQVWKQGPAGAAAVVKLLNDAVDGPRREAQEKRDLAAAKKQPTDHLPDPASIRLPLALERHRIGAAMSTRGGLGDRSTVERAVEDFAASVESLTSTNPPAEQAAIASARYELAFLRGWTNTGTPALAAAAAAMNTDPLVPADVKARTEAWAKARAGDPAGARTLFASLSSDPLARLALLQLDIESAAPGDAIDRNLAALASEAASSPVAAWAASVYAQRKNELPPVPRATEQANSMAEGIPAWIDDIARDPSRFVSVLCTAPVSNLAPTDPAIVQIKIRNNAPVPLAIGADGPISSEFLLQASVDAAGIPLPDRSSAEVINLDRRLRLMPREELVVSVWPDPGVGGWACQAIAAPSVRTRWRVIQAYRIDNGLAKPGPFGASVEVGPIIRAGLGTPSVDALVPELTAFGGEKLNRAVLQARLLLLNIGNERGTPVGDAHRLVGALVDRYKSGSAFERLLVLLHAPTARQSPIMIALDRAVAAVAETDPLVARVALVTRVGDADSPVLATLRGSTLPGVAAMASLVEQRLASSASSYARVKGDTVSSVTANVIREPK